MTMKKDRPPILTDKPEWEDGDSENDEWGFEEEDEWGFEEEDELEAKQGFDFIVDNNKHHKASSKFFFSCRTGLKKMSKKQKNWG